MRARTSSTLARHLQSTTSANMPNWVWGERALVREFCSYLVYSTPVMTGGPKREVPAPPCQRAWADVHAGLWPPAVAPAACRRLALNTASSLHNSTLVGPCCSTSGRGGEQTTEAAVGGRSRLDGVGDSRAASPPEPKGLAETRFASRLDSARQQTRPVGAPEPIAAKPAASGSLRISTARSLPHLRQSPFDALAPSRCRNAQIDFEKKAGCAGRHIPPGDQ
jgi:hypothetical protein